MLHVYLLVRYLAISDKMIDIATSTTYRLRVFSLRRRDLCLDYYYGSNTTTYRRRVFCFRLRSFCFTTYRRRGFCFTTYHYIQATGFLFSLHRDLEKFLAFEKKLSSKNFWDLEKFLTFEKKLSAKKFWDLENFRSPS